MNELKKLVEVNDTFSFSWGENNSDDAEYNHERRCHLCDNEITLSLNRSIVGFSTEIIGGSRLREPIGTIFLGAQFTKIDYFIITLMRFWLTFY